MVSFRTAVVAWAAMQTIGKLWTVIHLAYAVIQCCIFCAAYTQKLLLCNLQERAAMNSERDMLYLLRFSTSTSSKLHVVGFVFQIVHTMQCSLCYAFTHVV